jgi:maleylpyruvate isomerase
MLKRATDSFAAGGFSRPTTSPRHLAREQRDTVSYIRRRLLGHLMGERAVTAADVRAHEGISVAAAATARLSAAVAELDDLAVRGPSLLPGWTRGHVITHLARNADALVNLLSWARTGVESPMYASRADRDAAIEEGAKRGYLLLAEDLDAACARFAEAAKNLPDTAWSARLSHASGATIVASSIPWLRMREVWFHLVDLDVGVGFEDVPDELLEELIDDVVRQYDGRDDVPALTVETTLPDGRQRSWLVASNADSRPESPAVSGPGPALLAWLTGRSTGSGLTGVLPDLPRWN